MDEVMDLVADIISTNQLKETPSSPLSLLPLLPLPSPTGINNTFSPIILKENIEVDMKINGEINDKLKSINELELRQENTKECKLRIKQMKMELKELDKKRKETERQQREIQKENDRRQKENEKLQKEIQRENNRRQKENEKLQKDEEKRKKNYEKRMSQIKIEIDKQEEKEKLKNKREEDKQKILNEIIIALNDDEASDILLDELSSNFKSYEGRLFFKDGYVWIANERKIDDYVLNEILKSNIYAGINPITNLPISYSQNVANAKKIREALYAKIKINNNDTQLYNKFHSTTKGKICFKDGVLNFKNKTFTLWENIKQDEIYTTVIIDRNFNEYFNNPNQEDMNDIQTKILNVLYGVDVDKALHFLSRAIAGHTEDKNWATYLGNRNCGKGVQYDLLKTAFDLYVSTFVLGNMLCNKKINDVSDCSKKLYWWLDLEFVRLAISQEVPDPSTGLLLNSTMIKGITGDDTLVARRNFDRMDTHIKIDAGFFIFGNYHLYTTTDDCNETRISFRSLVQFKNKEEIELLDQLRDEDGEKMIEDELMNRFLVKDKTIKDKCKTIEWGNAMIMILMNNYRETPVIVKTEITESDNMYLLPAIRQLYDITNDDKDCVICRDLHNSLETFDKEKIKFELEELGINKKKSKLRGNTRDKLCYFGIKLREIKQDIVEEL